MSLYADTDLHINLPKGSPTSSSGVSVSSHNLDSSQSIIEMESEAFDLRIKASAIFDGLTPSEQTRLEWLENQLSPKTKGEIEARLTEIDNPTAFLQKFEQKLAEKSPGLYKFFSKSIAKEKDALEQKLHSLIQQETEQSIKALDAGYIEQRNDKGKVVKVKLTKQEVEAHRAEILSMNKDIEGRTLELAQRDNQAPYEFSLGFANVMTATVDAAPMIAQGIFRVDTSNPISTLMTIFFFAPFGVSAAAQAVSACAKTAKKLHINEKMDKLKNAFHPNTSKHVLAKLCLDITFIKEDEIVRASKEATSTSSLGVSFNKYLAAASKYITGSSGFTDTPAMLAGKACALKALKAVYDNNVEAFPPATFSERLTDWCLKHLSTNTDISLAAEDLCETFDQVVGELSSSSSSGCVIC